MTPTGSAANGEALARWHASAAYADMMAALEAEGWADYATANAEARTHPARWLRMHARWELAMQKRCGIDPRSTGTAQTRGAGTTEHDPHRARQGVSTRGKAGGSARRRKGAA